MINIDWSEIGKRIKIRRKTLDITQEQLAEHLSVSTTHLSKIETGKQVPAIRLFFNICDVLQTTPDYISLGTTHANNITQDTIEKLKLLSERDLEIVNSLIDTLIQLALTPNQLIG